MNPLTLAAYIYAAMVSWYPIANHSYNGDTPEQTDKRYHDISFDLTSVALDEQQEPLFGEADGRVKTAVLMISIAGYESGGFNKDVDDMKRKGDVGQSVCLMQVRGQYARGVVDRPSCFRAGLHALHDSFAMCPEGDLPYRMSGYTHGRCKRNEHAAVIRASRAVHWWSSVPVETFQFPIR